MKIRIIALLCTIPLLFTGCQTNKQTDQSIAGQFIDNFKALFGDSNDERLLASQEDFIGPVNDEYIPIEEEDFHIAFVDRAIPQPRYSPGDEGSNLPTVEKFSDPQNTQSVFNKLFFDTDDHVIRGKENIEKATNIANFLKTHPNTYIFTEGHCDQRGPEAYNLALGTRRANYVRNFLIQHGANPNQIHTVSYGKERLDALGNTPKEWAKNRRVQFKVYNKN